MWRREALRLSVTGAAALAAGCARETRGERSLRVATSPYVLNSGFYVAQELGHFRNAGIEIEDSLPGTSSDAIPLLAAGEIDVALFALSPALLNAIAAGARIRIVAARGVITPDCSTSPALYWRRDEFPSGVEGLRQLRGKRLAVGRLTTPSDFEFHMVLDELGMNMDEFEVLRLPSAEGMAALRSGQVDGMFGFGYIDRDLTEIAPELMVGLQLSDLFPTFQFSHVIFGERLLRSEVSLGSDFLEAYLEGVRDFRDGATPGFLEASALDFDEESPRQVCRTGISTDGALDSSDLTTYVRWAVRLGYVEKQVSASDLIDTRFLDLIAERGGVKAGEAGGGV
jgi:ABC-type nitrate/sulfonate/bicarbonate transport system substrate-binding protein